MKTAITEKLDALNIPYTIKPHKEAVYTSEDAARERGVRLSQIVKTMLLTNSQGDMVTAVIPGDRKLNSKKLKKLTGLKSLSFMNRESIEKNLGLVAGAIAPLGEIFQGIPLFVDPGVFAEPLVDISSGDPSAGLELKQEDLRRLLNNATIVEITRKE